jgi:glycosyltransferase involved in cell wall biosynthesis
MKNVCIIDSFSHKNLHETFNACFAVIVDEIFDNVTYNVCQSQRTAIETLIYQHGYTLSTHFSFNRIRVIERDGYVAILLRYLLSGLQNIRFLLTTKKGTLLVYCHNNPFSLLWLKALNVFLQKSILIICHGELQYLADVEIRSYKSIFNKLLTICLKMGLCFLGKSKCCFYLVLGDSIKENLLKYNYIPASQILVMDHPYFFNSTLIRKSKGQKLHIGTIGVFSPPKGALQFLNIAKHFECNDKIQFHVIGQVQGINIKWEDFPNILFHNKNNAFLKRDEFSELINRLDLATFFYPSDMYKLMASGAIFDAVEYDIPFISLRNDYFEYLVKKHGMFGFLCLNESNMQKVIQNISTNDNNLNDIKNIIIQVKEYHSISNISTMLKKELLKHNLLTA